MTTSRLLTDAAVVMDGIMALLLLAWEIGDAAIGDRRVTRSISP